MNLHKITTYTSYRLGSKLPFSFLTTILRTQCEKGLGGSQLRQLAIEPHIYALNLRSKVNFQEKKVE